MKAVQLIVRLLLAITGVLAGGTSRASSSVLISDFEGLDELAPDLPLGSDPATQILSAAKLKLGTHCIPKVHNCLPLACVNHTCSVCSDSRDCAIGQGPENLCVYDAAEKMKQCKHKWLMPYSGRDLVGVSMAFGITVLGAAGGLGGGGALVPVYLLLMGFDAHSSVPLAKATAFGAGVANVLFFWFGRHPQADRPLIDFDAASIFVPTSLLGTVVGVMANQVAPAWLVVTVLFVLLSFVTYKTFDHGIRQFQLELHQNPENKPLVMREAEADDLPRLSVSSTIRRASDDLPRVSVSPSSADSREASSPQSPSSHADELQLMLQQEAITPWLAVVSLLLLWCAVLAVSLLKGRPNAQATKNDFSVQCGSRWYWLLFGVEWPLTLIIAAVGAHRLLRKFELKELIGYPFLDDDVQWNRRNLLINAALVLLGGFFAGAVGLGSATATAPLLLMLGMNAEVVAATASFILLFTASSTSAQFLIVGAMPLDYASMLCFLGFAAAFTGQMTVGKIVRKYKRTSLVILSIALILGISAVLLSYTGMLYLILDVRTHSLGFLPLC